MKYLIVTLIKGEAADFQQKLLYDVAKRFNVNGAIERKPPAHITLKYSFETEKIDEIENVISEFCKNNKKCTYELKGFNHFAEDVVFIEVIPSKEMQETYHHFIGQLRKISWLPFNQFDGNTHFHASIAHADIKEKFAEIWDFVNSKQAHFKLEFDNISLFKMVDGVWKVHKEFSLK